MFAHDAGLNCGGNEIQVSMNSSLGIPKSSCALSSVICVYAPMASESSPLLPAGVGNVLLAGDGAAEVAAAHLLAALRLARALDRTARAGHVAVIIRSLGRRHGESVAAEALRRVHGRGE